MRAALFIEVIIKLTDKFEAVTLQSISNFLLTYYVSVDISHCGTYNDFVSAYRFISYGPNNNNKPED